MEDFADRYGRRLIKMVDIRASGKEFEFDQVLLMPTAAGYCALVEQARIEISPRIMEYLSLRWSEGSIENLSFFAVSADVYARSVSDPPVDTDVGRAILRHVYLQEGTKGFQCENKRRNLRMRFKKREAGVC